MWRMRVNTFHGNWLGNNVMTARSMTSNGISDDVMPVWSMINSKISDVMLARGMQ